MWSAERDVFSVGVSIAEVCDKVRVLLHPTVSICDAHVSSCEQFVTLFFFCLWDGSTVSAAALLFSLRPLQLPPCGWLFFVLIQLNRGLDF